MTYFRRLPPFETIILFSTKKLNIQLETSYFALACLNVILAAMSML